MEPDSYFEIRDKLINKLLVILAIIVFPPLVFSLLRASQTGWQPVFLIQICLVPPLILLTFFRKSIPLNLKAFFLILLSFTVAVAGFAQFSFNSAGTQYLMMGILMAVVFLGNRTAIWVYAVSAVTIIVVGILSAKGIIARSINFAEYNTYTSTWTNNLVTFLAILGLMIILVGNIGRLLNSKLMDLKRKNDELEKALSEIKTLRGIIPICSFCKKIRDDKGYWNQVEQYIEQHSEADFSHGICPECVKTHFPDFDQKQVNMKS